ncbi:MAG: secondary thiamine-phosphate synthase enzyme YjbQ [Oscillospiraceae bacterium]|nr:secondary thiamine-phosphate synthase enzyme YjbQ [Oscillospiraceae bacterium]
MTVVIHQTLCVQSDARPTFHDMTDDVARLVRETAVQNGIVIIYSQHTTCSVIIQEQSDDVNYYGTQLILQDMVDGLAKLFPTCQTQGQYAHPGALHIQLAQRERGEEAWWSLNTDAHLRSVLLGRSQTVPIVDGQMTLGDFGRIYFADFDQVRGRQRTVRVQIMGE